MLIATHLSSPFLKHHIMILSGCIPTTKRCIPLASLSSNSSRPPARRRPSRISTPKPNHTNQNQPSVAEIEQAIGAGIYRDHDPDSDSAKNKTLIDVVLSNSIGVTEGSTEQKLRETGEWISTGTEKATRSAGKKILEIMFFWIAPAWFILLLIATGGAISASLTTPLDVVKTRLMTQGHVEAVNKVAKVVYGGVSATVTQILKEEGWVGFTRGMGPRVVHSACFSVLGYFAFETARLAISEQYLRSKEGKEMVSSAAVDDDEGLP